MGCLNLRAGKINILPKLQKKIPAIATDKAVPPTLSVSETPMLNVDKLLNGEGGATKESTETNEATQTQPKETKNQQTPNSSTQGSAKQSKLFTPKSPRSLAEGADDPNGFSESSFSREFIPFKNAKPIGTKNSQNSQDHWNPWRHRSLKPVIYHPTHPIPQLLTHFSTPIYLISYWKIAPMRTQWSPLRPSKKRSHH